jgi:hypothetical protein
MSTTDLWTYRDQSLAGTDLSGFSVEALDGGIGKIDEATFDIGESFVVVDTGPWIFGRKVVLPAGVIRDIDLDAQTVFVNRTKDQIKNAPEFDEMRFRDTDYRSELAAHYGPGGPGFRDEDVL